jgi:LysR family glycine cleavage system transcriptional activator
MNHLNLNWLRTFEAVARCSGFTAASKELGLTQTAVSLQIKALETKIGHDLFIRRAKSVELTDIAKAYLPSVRNSLEALSLSTNGLFGPDLKNTIVVRASMACILWLAPRLGTFQELYPSISIKLVTSIWAMPSDTQNVDINIVLAPNNHSNSHYEKLSDEFIVPVCGSDTAHSIYTVHDLLEVKPIHVLGFDDHWARYLSAFKLNYEASSVNLMADTAVAACELAAADLGVAIVIERFSTNAIKMGQKVKIVGGAVPLGQSHFLERTKTRKEIQASTLAFEKWLRDQFNQKE